MAGQFAPDAAALERLAMAAVERLPAAFREHVAPLAILVEEFADDATLDALGLDDPFALTGLYQGRPIGEPPQTGDPPTTIHLYRRPILDEWIADGHDLAHLVTHVVIHEIGHHFGLSDADMHALEEAAR